MNYILIGLPLSGKTTLGKKLAESLSYPFFDTDQLIEEATGQSCRTLFLSEGEHVFRVREKEVIAALNPTTPTIISVGGGALLDSANVAKLKTLGTLIYLKTSLKDILKFIDLDHPPVYLDRDDPHQSFRTLAALRIPLYQQAAQIIHNTEEPLEALLSKIQK
ncbi:MAG: shikimate kinase [Chlamydiia bacterium]|nr:shikimate kinase [Chlamydiia bacterium]